MDGGFMERRAALEAAVPLKPEFRFAHEPLGSDADVGFVGRDEDVHALAQRLLFSQGGSFLITGYRGVGKTSFVNQVIGEVSRVVQSKRLAAVCTDVVEVRLNLARALQPAELMHHIVRRLFDSLDEAGILEQLPPKVRRDLTLAYVRTSMNVSQKLATSTELAVGMPGIELGAAPFKMSTQGLFTRKSGLTHNEEASFLTYDDRAAEHDLIRLAQELTRGFEVHDSRIRRLARMMLGRRKPTRRLKVVFVFDELDKLDTEIAPDAEQSRSPIDELLNVLKTLFTTSGITFVFVAGKELQERWLEDVGRGDSVYESVFSYDRYLTCIWTDSDAATGGASEVDPIDALCSRFVDLDMLQTARPRCARCPGAIEAQVPFCESCGQYLLDASKSLQVFGDVKDYVAYIGRGIPRRLNRAFNELVRWYGVQPFLVVEPGDYRRIRFYAALERLLREHDQELGGTDEAAAAGAQTDRRRLGLRYLIDCMLLRGAKPFTFEDVLSDSSRLSKRIAPRGEVAEEVIQNLIDFLIKHEYLELVDTRDRAIVGREPPPNLYRVPQRRLVELGGRPVRLEEDAALTRSAEPQRQRVGRFRLLALIGQGGMGNVFRAVDGLTGKTVAVKLLREQLRHDESMLQRFRREANAMKRLRHPSLVHFIEDGEVDGQSYIAMDFIDGINLRDVQHGSDGLDVAFALTVASTIAEVAAYIHDQGLVRLDIKPSNIVLAKDGRIILLDLGLVRNLSRSDEVVSAESPDITGATTIIGTPGYMAPEQVLGGVLDGRADVYALGIVLYEMLAGTVPFRGETPVAAMRRQMEEPPPRLTRTDVPYAVEQVVMKAIARDMAERFATMREFEAALRTLLTEVGSKDMRPVIESTRKRVEDLEQVADDKTAFIGRVGMADLTPVATRAPWPAPSTEVYEVVLRITSGPRDVTREYTLTKRVTRIGRGLDNDIVLNDPKLSRYHASIEHVEDDGYVLNDLNTANGTLVNGVSVDHSISLRPEDRITLGDYVLELTYRKQAVGRQLPAPPPPIPVPSV